jgi:1-acyl-sn-glycerol-3-phosphate acyltransferase
MAIVLLCATLLTTLVFYDVLIRVRLLLRRQDAVEFFSRFQHASSRRVIGQAHAFCGFSLEVLPFRGELPRQCLLVSNHQSLIDIPVLMRAFPGLDLRFVAKRELGRGIPGVSVVLRFAHHALIGRKSGFAEANRALRRLGRLAGTGVSPVVFPEGTRSRTGAVQRFHAAAVRVLADATPHPLPVLSVAMDGGHRISGIKAIARNLRGSSYRVQPLTLYPAIESRADLAAVLGSARREIMETLADWRAGEG